VAVILSNRNRFSKTLSLEDFCTPFLLFSFSVLHLLVVVPVR